MPFWFRMICASELCRPFKSNLIAPMLLVKPEAVSGQLRVAIIWCVPWHPGSAFGVMDFSTDPP